ncbi:hypothetical protein PVAP13_4KG108210 [Panicum virgatum]|uniref:Uncharacterized protein n=1 Tax=Panicum virgatum TaxID=38727 RepID=A0A8T0TRH5_PANVG|nr:hypothetical protein PVAP13_4KG108210 [Panicum virgatum]
MSSVFSNSAQSELKDFKLKKTGLWLQAKGFKRIVTMF